MDFPAVTVLYSTTLRVWAESLPGDQVRARPQLGLCHAWALAHSKALERVEVRVLCVEAWLEEQPKPLEDVARSLSLTKASHPFPSLTNPSPQPRRIEPGRVSA